MSPIDKIMQKILDNFDGITPQKLKEYADEVYSYYQKLHEKNLELDFGPIVDLDS